MLVDGGQCARLRPGAAHAFLTFLDRAHLALFLGGVCGLVPLRHVELLEMDVHEDGAPIELAASEARLFSRGDFRATIL
jgi:hypothetical protein